MSQKTLNFLRYHNGIPIILGVLFLGAGATFAASEEVRGTVISSETVVQSVDNTYLLSINLDTFNSKLSITAITEDNDFYYVSYSYNTILIDNYVWRDIIVKNTLAVSKAALGGRDLGSYVAEQLGEEVEAKLDYVAEAQKIEQRNGTTQKVATTEYSGLIGKFLDSKEETFEGYTPVIEEKRPVIASIEEAKQSKQIAINNEITAQVIAASVPSKEEIKQIIQDTVKELLAEDNTINNTTPDSSPTDVVVGADTEAPVITVVGNNPAEIVVGSDYVDLGATVVDNENNNIGIHYKIDDVEVSSVNIDTSADRTFTITYSATDQAGNTATSERTVIVGTGILAVPDEVIEEPVIEIPVIELIEEIVTEDAASTTPSTATSTSAE